MAGGMDAGSQRAIHICAGTFASEECMPRVRVQPAHTAGVMQQINSSMHEEIRGDLAAVAR